LTAANTVSDTPCGDVVVVIDAASSPYLQFVSRLWPPVLVACLAPVFFVLPIILRRGRDRTSVARGMFKMYGALTVAALAVVGISVAVALAITGSR